MVNGDDNFAMGDLASPDPEQLARERAIRFRANASNMATGVSLDYPAPPTGEPGLLVPGTIDLANRPVVHNPDGTISTVRSIGTNIGGKETLLPTVYGQSILNDDDAIRLYKMTGQHLGQFATPEASDAYAQKLHEEQAKMYGFPLGVPASWAMGALAAQDQYRPLGNDPWTGLMPGQRDLPLQGAPFRDPNSPVAFRTASPLVNITQGDIENAANLGLMFSGGGLKTEPIPPRAPKTKGMGDILSTAQEPYDFLTGVRPNAPYPQFAYKYPDIGPPTIKPKISGEGVYPEKTLTPEAEAFAKTRAKIMADMEKEGYQPFFDPSQRFPAEFSKQPGPHLDTATVLAKKQETLDRHLAYIDTPETRQALRDAYSKGLDLPDSQAWYMLGQVEKKMIADMGEEAGRKHFRDTFATSLAATTTGMTPSQNLIMAQYLNYLKATGQPFPTASHMTPVAVGGQRTMPNVEAYQKTFEGGGYSALGPENPKRADFAQAQMGNPNAFTIDEQMAHGMLGVDVPQKGTYGLVTKLGREEALKAGVEPQRYQDVAWAGFKKKLEEESRAKKGYRPYGPGEGYQGKPMINEVNDMIERMHRLTGMPRQEIWTNLFIKNRIPVYGVGGLTMGGLAAPYTEPPASQ
jgi:hypothetical protein